MLSPYIEPNSVSWPTFPSSSRWFSSKDSESPPSSSRSDDFPENAANSKSSVRILSQTVEGFIVFAFSSLSEVDCIFATHQGNVCHAWIVINDFTDLALDRVCEREELVIDEFSHCHFDFKII